MNVKVTTLGSFWTEFLNEAWTKNSINRLLVKFGTVDRRPGSGRRGAHWWKHRHSWVAVAKSGRQTSEPPNSQRNFTWGGDPSIISFADYSQRSASVRLNCCKKRRAQQLTEAHSMHALFSACSLRDDNVITSKRTWKIKHANSILEPSEYLWKISSKSIHIISRYTVSKLGRFLRHSVLEANISKTAGDSDLVTMAHL